MRSLVTVVIVILFTQAVVADSAWDHFWAAQNYLSTTGVSTSAIGNRGIESYNAKMISQNKCFSRLVEGFYQNVAAVSKDNVLRLGQVQSLAENSENPGWFWKLALDEARGDGGLALRLIGVCGHDNMYQGYRGCPKKGNSIFLPGSLGSRVDISPQLKKAIVAAQAPTKGPRALPSKYYHIMGAAFVSCVSIEDGNDVSSVISFSRRAAVEYRTQRICMFDSRQKLLGFSDQQLITALARLRKGQCSDKACEAVKSAFTSERGGDSGERIAKALPLAEGIEKLKRGLTQAYAYNFAAGPISCTAGFSDRFRRIVEGGASGRLNACVGFEGTNLCKRVQEKLGTWKMDYAWSEAQHQIGAEFAAKHCHDRRNKPTFEASACSALKSATGSRPSSSSQSAR